MTDHHHTAPPEPAPIGDGPLVLDIGGDVGALVVYAGPAQLGVEIHLHRADDPASRTHNVVRERHLGGHHLYAAVFPALPAGRYLVVPPPDRVATPVHIIGGRVAETDWGRVPSPGAHEPVAGAGR